MIKVFNLKKYFKKNYVLKDISAIFDNEKINLIIGPSGSGKTIFLKCLLKILEPSSGEIYYEGINSNLMKLHNLKKFRKNIGAVFQNNALFDSMNVEENISFPLKMFTNNSKFLILEKVHKILERLKLKNVYHKYPSELSGGMKKRVAIARAIINNPKFLFLDEPNSGLDPENAIIIDKLIFDITKEYKITTIISTHDMNSVMEIGEKIFFLKNGMKIWEGNSKDILKTNNENVKAFVYSSFLLRKFLNKKNNYYN